MSTLWLKKQRLKCPLSAGFGFPDIYVTSWWHKIVLLCYLKIIFFCQNTVESEWNKSKKYHHVMVMINFITKDLKKIIEN